MSKVTKGARKSLIWLAAILVAIYALLAVGVATGKTTLTPGLALDLAGGRQIILTPVLDEGSEQDIEQTDLDQAVSIIRQRVDASGVAEAEITTQGDNIVIGLPGNPDDATIDLVSQAAQLQFRSVLIVGDPSPVADPSAEPSPQPSAGEEAAQLEGVEPTATPSPSPSASNVANVVTDAEPEPTTSASAEATAEPTPSPAPSAATPDRETTDGSSFDWLTPAAMEDYNALDCLDPENYAGRSMGDPDTAYSACALDPTGPAKIAMGPVEVTGDDLETASSGPRQNQAGSFTGDYEVRLTFNDAGAAKFDEVTTRLVDLESPRNQFAIVLDGTVISHPQVTVRISNGEASISGGFTQEQAEQLANQLRFGALPLSLEVQSNQQISATLGADQLQKGLIAGAIGLLLVAIYSLFQYRALGFVTIASLVIAGGLTFGVISLLSWGLDYRLSLAGIAGVIVSIGITADSFIVYFERIRDELREGRSLASAVDHAWSRARRTILISDAVSLLAAVTLYILAVGGVRGFAFTLGLVTVIDVLVVFLFTHPIMVLLAKTKFFGEGHPMSGLDPRQLGREALYKGRGRVRSTPGAASSDGLTLAERKAAARRAAAGEPSATDVAAVNDEADAVDSETSETSETKGDAR